MSSKPVLAALLAIFGLILFVPPGWSAPVSITEQSVGYVLGDHGVDIGSKSDAHVASGYPGSNYGTNGSFYLRSGTTYYGNERLWLQFDLDGHLPAGAAVVSATLRLYCYGVDATNDLAAAVHGAEYEWTETALTWNSQPTIDDIPISLRTMTAGDKNRWIELDVTSFVQARWGADKRVSLVVKPVDEGSTTARTFSFDAKEYSSSLAPRLHIEYKGEWDTAHGFKIFHMNDVHSRMLPHDFDLPQRDDLPVMEQVGGAAYFASKLLALKAANPNSLVLDAGDISEGSPLGDLRGNGGMVDFYNLPVDQMLLELSTNFDNISFIDSPLQNLALFQDALDGTSALAA